MADETGNLVIIGRRGGSITEISTFLSDLEGAYVALYSFHRLWLPERLLGRLPSRLWLELGYPNAVFGHTGYTPLTAELIPPSARLTLKRVRIDSPGYWEFFASLNLLQQIREYLNDRHRHRQDREFREASERTRLELENEMIRRQIEEKDIANLRERIAILRDVGYDDDDIRRIVWMSIGNSLTRLGRHQDTRLIDGAK